MNRDDATSLAFHAESPEAVDRERQIGIPFDLASSKLRLPAPRRGTVLRSALVEQLVGGGRRSVVSIVAPAGYGKTTLLSQWAERDDRPFAWVSVDEWDNDAKLLLA